MQPCSLKQASRACHLAFGTHGQNKSRDSPISSMRVPEVPYYLLRHLSPREQVSYPSHNTSLGFNMAGALCIN